MKLKIMIMAALASMFLCSCGEQQPKFEKKGRLLVIVDVQRDFFDPSGSLYVQGSEVLPEKIMGLAGIYDGVILTMDWHPGDHCSFVPNGGTWPPHCVAYTQGAGLPDEFFIMLRSKHKHKARIFLKGCDPDKEEYGAFDDLSEYPELEYWFKNCDRVDVCGIAGDYCVKETTKNILKYVPAEKICILKDYTRSIDGGEALDKFITDNSLQSR